MDTELKYRILESQGLFHPQIWVKRTEEILVEIFIFRPDKYKTIVIEGWEKPNDKGRERYRSTSRIFPHHQDPPCNSFKTLEEAKEQIKIWQTPDKIHDI